MGQFKKNPIISRNFNNLFYSHGYSIAYAEKKATREAV
jgi:hypothetical protein